MEESFNKNIVGNYFINFSSTKVGVCRCPQHRQTVAETGCREHKEPDLFDTHHKNEHQTRHHQFVAEEEEAEPIINPTEREVDRISLFVYKLQPP